jgi:O-succinylbenzoic acid--CoA ligase
MTRDLAVVDSGEASRVLEALRVALSGGPAVLPHPGTPLDVPRTVAKPVAVVVETSGSTGAPKRVALSADALLASAAASASALEGQGQWLLALPAHYIAGINVLVRSLAAETEPVVIGPGHFEPRGFLAAARAMDHPLRFTSLVPAQLSRLIAADGGLELLRRFDRILVGGQATPPALVGRCLELGLNITRSYGSSETCGGCVYDGMPIGNTRVRIVDGRVELAGSVLAEGYLDADLTEEAFHSDAGTRWYRTNDSGRLDDGRLQITGRIDDVIVSGGMKVSLAAIERVVRSLDGLSGAVVVAVSSQKWGQVPVVVMTGSAASVNLSAVRAALVAALGPAAAPDAVVEVAEIPRLDSGKPDRRALTARLAGGEGTAASSGTNVTP